MKWFNYAGIGSRATPDQVLQEMTTLAGLLEERRWYLRSGGARGADSAFAQGASPEFRRIYLPWPGFNGLSGSDCHAMSEGDQKKLLPIAERFHPEWGRCSPAVRKLHARNVAIMLSLDLSRRVDAVICWTPDGRITGGTGMALRLASHYKIPSLNMATVGPKTIVRKLDSIAKGRRFRK